MEWEQGMSRFSVRGTKKSLVSVGVSQQMESADSLQEGEG